MVPGGQTLTPWPGGSPHLPGSPGSSPQRGSWHSQGSSGQRSFPGWQGMRGREGFGGPRCPGCWAPRNNRSLLDSVFLPFFKHLALSLSRNKIATRNVHKYLVCLESPVSVTALPGSLFHISKVLVFCSVSSGGCVSALRTPPFLT